jgi:tripartite-type tricarboxylate transporter receptor subunit TctC
MRRQFLKSAAAVVAGISAMGFGSIAAAQDAADFYKDNVIKWIVPYDPGGGYDEYSRIVAPYLEKYTGARVDIVNMPGSGGMKGAVEIFNSPADGTYIGIINGSAMVTNQLAGIEGADYRVSEYEYLGRIVADKRVMVASKLSGIETFDDLMGNGKPEIVGATGLGGSTYVDAVITGDVLGIDQRVVHGFDRSGDIRTAMLRGDVQAMWGSLGSALSGIESGDHKVILHGEKNPTGILEGIPSIYDIAMSQDDAERKVKILESWEALSAVGRPVAAPPGVPEDRLAFLRDAFSQAMNDPEFVAAAEAADRELSYASGDDMAAIAAAATELEPDVEALFVAAIRGEI